MNKKIGWYLFGFGLLIFFAFVFLPAGIKYELATIIQSNKVLSIGFKVFIITFIATIIIYIRNTKRDYGENYIVKNILYVFIIIQLFSLIINGIYLLIFFIS